MTSLPITHLTLYKHGVGYFQRQGKLHGEQTSLTFRVEALNDVLKSLTAIDWGDGQVLGIEYPSPQTREELLAGSSIHLDDQRSLQDLLKSLRGRQVRLLLDQGESREGVLVGLDEAPAEQPLATALVSLLQQDEQVTNAPLARLHGVALLDADASADLRFFLASSLTQEAHRQVTIRLTPGDHDLTISYVAPAPTWRVSYRLVIAPAAAGQEPQALLLGWGIFDNRLEEDLQGINLSLVAGMPISFIYDLVTPFTPARPEVKEEGRVAAGPVAFAAGAPPMMMRAAAMETADAAPRVAGKRALNAQALDRSTQLNTEGNDLGELFEYAIATPVTVGRGQSAMVPIVSTRLAARKELLYNGSKQAKHPVATLRLHNGSGVALERGPLTVLDGSHYAGEALLAYTAPDGEIVAAYAVELGVAVTEESEARRELHSVRIRGHYLLIEEWELHTRRYTLQNSSNKAHTVLVEQARTTGFALVDSPQPHEQGAAYWRFAVQAPAHSTVPLAIHERRLLSRQEEIRHQSATVLQDYARRGLLNAATQGQLNALLALWQQLAAHEQRLAELEQQRQKLSQSQEQLRANMTALSATGKEGELRAGYVDKLRSSEQQLETLAQEETRLRAEIARLNQEINSHAMPL